MSKDREGKPPRGRPENGCREELEARGEQIELKAGESLFEHAAPAHDFLILRRGALQARRRRDGHQWMVEASENDECMFLPTVGLERVTATASSQLVGLTLADMRDAAGGLAPFERALVQAFTELATESETQVRQDEKLAALGRRSAGIAHELKNPAAASSRAAAELRSTLEELHERLMALTGAGLSSDERAALADPLRLALQPRRTVPDPLGAADLEEEMESWLDDHDVAESWRLAPAFADGGISIESLETMIRNFDEAMIPDVLESMAGGLSVGRILSAIETSNERISEVVAATKAYAYMEQTLLQEVDIHKGLESALVILSDELKRGTKVQRRYDSDLPQIEAFAADLNTVWHNLIDNAVDALDGKGTITITTTCDNEWVVVEVGDDGPGVPAEIQERVFEPFFTTKGMGRGTGLGLDAVYRIVVEGHHGEIRLESEPGATRFVVRLPVKQPKSDSKRSDDAEGEGSGQAKH